MDLKLGQSDYMVGKLADVATPHWFLSFLDIMMYPSCPQLVPQLKWIFKDMTQFLFIECVVVVFLHFHQHLLHPLEYTGPKFSKPLKLDIYYFVLV